MGSLRNPVGPLPSTIYWRRRAVLLSVLGLLALLTVWVVGTGGGAGNNNGGGSNGKNPASSITPGPSGSGPAISQHPGGRDESSGDGDSGGGSGGGGGDDAGGGSGGGSGDGSTGSGASTGGGSDEGTGSGGGSGDQLPVGSTLPNCTASNVKLTIKSERNSYAPGERPTIEIVAKNSSGSDCKVDLGPKSTVLTITQAGGDDDIWASDDCPKGTAGALYRVPAGSQVTYPVKWDRRPGAPDCATPPPGSAPAGTYLVEAKAPGLAKAQASFVLSKD